MEWQGGHPLHGQSGSCSCNSDAYCLCTPSLAIDLIIQSGPDHVWLVQRRDTNQLAAMGGFVWIGESVEETVRRELREEMGITLDSSVPLRFVGVYSDPRRDNRRHTVSVVYAIQLDGTERPVASDDAKAVKRLHWSEIEQHEYFADHRTLLLDYRETFLGGRALEVSRGDFSPDIARSICGARVVARGE